jgi:Na+-driven multidrug efflux pump
MGAALATLVTQAMASAFGLAILLRGKHAIQVSRKGFVSDAQCMKRAFFPGVPGSIELLTRALDWMVMSFLVATFGTIAIAAYGVGSNILQIVTIYGPVDGRLDEVIAMVSQWVVQFPLAYVLSKHTSLGDLGLWWSFPVVNVIVVSLPIAWYARGQMEEDKAHRG